MYVCGYSGACTCTMATVRGSHLSKAQLQSTGSCTIIHSCVVAITLYITHTHTHSVNQNVCVSHL